MKKQINQNDLTKNLEANVMFIDMNSFFASCEQQDDSSLRNKPIVVCTYKSDYSPIIAPSIEAKKFGVKTGMRMNDAKKLCPDLIQVDTSPNRYRKYHIQIIDLLKTYAQDVIPKSIDEAVINLRNYKLVYDDLPSLAKQIKKDIHDKVGDWLQCSIGIAPNTFLAKLASDIQKPNGLVIINPDTIDGILSKLKLEDLPGISKGNARKLVMNGINSPYQLRHTEPYLLKRAMNSIVGYYWHCRLNFMEVDLSRKPYKTMQAMRKISKENRNDISYLNDLLINLCIKLEKRMVSQELYARKISIAFGFENYPYLDSYVSTEFPVQDSRRLLEAFRNMIHELEQSNKRKMLDRDLTSLSLMVSNFVNSDTVHSNLFYTDHKRDKLRKTIYDLKGKYGERAVLKGVEMKKNQAFQDLIGFGSIKDLEDFTIDDEEPEFDNEEDYDLF